MNESIHSAESTVPLTSERSDLQQVVRATASIARASTGPLSEEEKLRLALAMVVDCVTGCDEAGVMLIHRDRIETRAPTSDLVIEGDRLQYEFHEGPCLDSVLQHTSVVGNRIAEDPRWPRWGAAVSERLGVQAMLSLLLFSNEQSYGAMNLYATTIDAFDRDDMVVAQALSTHLAVMLATGRELDHRATALVNRTVIGQAEGILMERHKIEANAAFQMLRKASQDTNRRLATIADELVRTGALPSRRPR